MVFVNSLNVMQDGFRLNKEQLCDMVQFIANGGKFNHESLLQHNSQRTSLIAIVEFEDGNKFIRDGLHRATVISFARNIPYIFHDEYVVEKMTYSMYLKADIENQWYTPFDPRIEVRKSDFFDFKNEVLSQNQNEIIDFIKQNKSRYAIPKNDNHIISNYVNQLASIYFD